MKIKKAPVISNGGKPLKKITVILLLLCASVSAQSLINQPFYQDVATIFTLQDGLPDSQITRIFLDDGQPVAISPKGAVRWTGEKWQTIHIKMTKKQQSPETLPPEAGEVLTTAALGQTTAVGCRNGLYLYTSASGEWRRALPADKKYSWALRNVGALVVDSQERLWFGAEQGVGFWDGSDWHLFSGNEGLPYTHFTCTAAGPDGIVWFGTEKGAIRFAENQFYYRHSRRWLPDDHVNEITVQPDGTAWFATPKGIGRIQPLKMTLEKKAAYFINQIETRHNYLGFVYHCHLKQRFNPDSWEPALTDNAGLYTSWYGAAMAFRYALTKDSRAKKLAKRSFQAMKWLVDITPEPGFPARLIIPADWSQPVNEMMGHEYNRREMEKDPFWKDIYPRFPLTKDGKYRWKCDTSSDELAGHYFFYGIYYDLVAETEAEKQPVREVVAAITDHLIRHGFMLVDYDGDPTRWGKFNPDYFHSAEGWDQRGLNSMMMLSFLKVASHVTGDAKYDEIAADLRRKYHYHINSMESKQYFPPENVVPWDNNLCLMSWYGLFNYETNPELLLLYRQSLEYAWLHISQQKNAFWNALFGAMARRFTKLVDDGLYESNEVFPQFGNYTKFTVEKFYQTDPQRDHILETLYRTPLDLIGYEIDNMHRLDVIFDNTPRQKSYIGWRIDGNALPIDERGCVRLNRDGFALYLNRGNGWVEYEGTFYLLPYYLARYHQILE